MERSVAHAIQQDLSRKMVFLAGPRQVGKTTLAKRLLDSSEGYLNWDIPDQRERILAREYPPSPMLVFDEIHKYVRWRDYLKGFYDELGDRYRVLVTGSARLDLYRYGGDSLQGRYHFHRLLPLGLDELSAGDGSVLQDLFVLGGFPEPFLGGSEREARRWSREYRHLLINEEITSLERVSDLGTMQVLARRLPELVGAPLSLNGLREDLQVSHKTVSRWVDIFERLYMLFRLAPFGAANIRAVKKEKKHYFFDWTTISDAGMRFENLVAVQLLRLVYSAQDSEGFDYELLYFRDTDAREVDFVVAHGTRPLLAVEVKLNDRPVSKSLVYFKKKFPAVHAYQVSLNGTADHINRYGIRCAPLTPLVPEWQEVILGSE